MAKPHNRTSKALWVKGCRRLSAMRDNGFIPNSFKYADLCVHHSFV